MIKFCKIFTRLQKPTLKIIVLLFFFLADVLVRQCHWLIAVVNQDLAHQPASHRDCKSGQHRPTKPANRPTNAHARQAIPATRAAHARTIPVPCARRNRANASRARARGPARRRAAVPPPNWASHPPGPVPNRRQPSGASRRPSWAWRVPRAPRNRRRAVRRGIRGPPRPRPNRAKSRKRRRPLNGWKCWLPWKSKGRRRPFRSRSPIPMTVRRLRTRLQRKRPKWRCLNGLAKWHNGLWIGEM